MPLNFWKDDADTGSSKEAAIEPIENSDPLEEGNLNRAAQNLRNRTEVVRTDFDNLEAVERSDRSLLLLATTGGALAPGTKAGVYVIGGGFRFSLGSTGADGNYDRDMLITPCISPSITGSTNPVLAKLYYDDTSNGEFKIEVDGSRKVVGGSHNILFRMWKGTQSLGNVPIVTLEGNISTPPIPTEGPFVIAVELSTDDDTKISGIVSQINASSANNLVTATATGSSDNYVTDTDWPAAGPGRLYQGDDGSVGGVDDEAYLIPGTAFDNFFDAVSKYLEDGDVLVLDRLDAETRRGNTTQTTITDADLHIISPNERDGVDTRNTADNMGTIPICKRYGDSVIFFSGKTIKSGQIDYIVDSKQQSDDIRSDLAAETGSPDGDHMVGCEAKASTHLTLAQGTLNTQLDTLAALGGEGSGTSGDGNIGAYAVAGSPQAFGTGTVRSQLGEMVGFYNNHATAAADQHKLIDVTNRPFIVVDKDGNGDRVKIEDAISDLATTGGTIYIMRAAAAYSEGVDLSAIDPITKPIEIIGEGGPSALIWTDDGVHPAIDAPSGTVIQAPITFRNIWFASYTAAYSAISFEGTHHVNAKFMFIDCTFSFGVAKHSVPMIAQVDNETLFRRCHFVSNDYTDDQPALALDSTVDGQGKMRVHNCTFKDVADIANIAMTNAFSIDDFVLADSTITDCGYSPADNTQGIMIESSDEPHNSISLLRNRVDGASATNAKSGLFCDLFGYNNISDNVILRGYKRVPTSGTIPYQIRQNGEPPLTAVISNNEIYPENACGIRADAQALVSGNSVIDSTLDLTSAVAVIYSMGENSRISGNFVYSSTGKDFKAGIHAAGAYSTVIGNTVQVDFLTAVHTNTTCIVLAGNACSATGNTVKTSNITNQPSLRGFYVNGDRCVVASNTIHQAAYGVVLSSGHNASIHNNTMYLTDVAVDVVTSNDVVITGNVITMNDDSSAIVFDMNSGACVRATISDNIVATTGEIQYFLNSSGSTGLQVTGNNCDVNTVDTYVVIKEGETDFSILNNRFKSTVEASYGIYAQGEEDTSKPITAFRIIGNQIYNATFGIFLRGWDTSGATHDVTMLREFVIANNQIFVPEISVNEAGIAIQGSEGLSTGNMVKRVVKWTGTATQGGYGIWIRADSIKIGASGNWVSGWSTIGNQYKHDDAGSGKSMGMGPTAIAYPSDTYHEQNFNWWDDYSN